MLERAATQVSVQVIRPFRAIPGASGRLTGFDYALPVDQLDDGLPHGIVRLRALYRRLHAPLRLEFNESCWPGLAAALDHGGLVNISRGPVMVCGVDSFQPPNGMPVAVRFEAIDQANPSRTRVVGEVDGTTVGRAAIAGADGIAELYGVVTEPAFRRRGVGAALCSALIAWHFQRGGSLVFLEADSNAAAALYAKLGFTPVDWRLTYAEP